MDIIIENNQLTLTINKAQIALNHPDPKAQVILSSTPADYSKSYKGLVLDSPGEYEVNSIMIDGIYLDPGHSAYTLENSFIHCLWLADYDQTPSEKQFDQLDQVNVLVISLDNTNFDDIDKLIKMVEPIIVVAYGNDSDKKATFKKEVSQSETLDKNKLKISKKDLEVETTSYYLV